MNIKNEQGYTALLASDDANSIDPQITLKLIEEGAHVEFKHSSGLSPLGLAVFYNELHVAKEMVSKGAQPAKMDAFDTYPFLQSAFTYEAQSGDPSEMIGYMINLTPELKDIKFQSFEWNVIHYSAEVGSFNAQRA